MKRKLQQTDEFFQQKTSKGFLPQKVEDPKDWETFSISFSDNEEEEIFEKNKSNPKNEEVLIKTVKIIEKSNGEKSFYNFSWRKNMIAYYICNTEKCKGRAKASLTLENGIYSILGDLIVIIY